jgi:4'-phosphopantetheinyl transferase
VAIVISGVTGAVLTAIPEAQAYLTSVELERASAFRRRADRDDFVAAHSLVRVAAGALLSEQPLALTMVQACQACQAPHGVPRLREHPEIGLSMSHTHGFVAVAASPTPIGVDVEVVRREHWDLSIASLVLSPAELDSLRDTDDPAWAFVRQWVRKEALVKVGVCELDDLPSIDLPIDGSAILTRGQQGPSIRWNDWVLFEWVPPEAGDAVGCVVVPRGTAVTMTAVCPDLVAGNITC